MADARKDKRTLLSLKIRYKSATLEDFIERYSGDISRGGVFIKAKKPLAVGTLLKFEFMLQDESTLIHGVGRVIWRRDPSEADEHNPAGMGIKFIKMDPESRALVQRIAEGRQSPGVFEQGEEGSNLVATPVPSASDGLVEEDRTKVRHVSEFLASALEEGGAGEAATREAQAGAERARQLSHEIDERRAAAARGALSVGHRVPTDQRPVVSDAASRSAMSAFGGGSVSQAISAPPEEEFDAEDDFLDHDTTKIHDYPEADATVVAGAGAMPFVSKRPTPVVPASASSSPLEADFFGPSPSGLEPAPGEFLDPSLLDPVVPTVPPPAGVPEGPGIPVEAFKSPSERAPAASTPIGAAQPSAKRGSNGFRWAFLVLFVLIIGGGTAAGWYFGLLDGAMDLASPYVETLVGSTDEASASDDAPAVAQAVVPVEDPTAAEDPTPAEAAAEPTEASAEPTVADTDAADVAFAKLVVESRPNGAFVSVDGQAAGRTPLELDLEVGTKVSLWAKARRFLPRRQQVTVQPDNPTVKLVLAPLPYVVQVQSDPPGARAISVGGGEVTTPGELRFRSMPSSRSITVSKDGYETVSKAVRRADFREESRRMFVSISVKLPSAGGVEPPPPSAPEAPEPTSPAEVAPVEGEPEPTPEPEGLKKIEAAPAPSETAADDAP